MLPGSSTAVSITRLQGRGAVTCLFNELDLTHRTLTIEDSRFESNIAERGASSVAVENYCSLAIRDTQFVSNQGTAVVFQSSDAGGTDQFVVRLRLWCAYVSSEDGAAQ